MITVCLRTKVDDEPLTQRTLFGTHQGRPVTTLDTVWDYAM
jgi:hypothetical protein